MGLLLLLFLVLPIAAKPKMERALQLYSIREVIGSPETYAKNHVEVYEKLKKWGYTAVEAANYDQEKGTFYGVSPQQFRADCEAAGLKCLSSHATRGLSHEEIANRDFAEALRWWDKAIADHLAAGMKYIVTPGWGQPKDLVEAQTLCDYANEIGKKCRAAGLLYGYHTHSGEFRKVENKPWIEYMMEHIAPENMFWQMDTYWCVMAQQSPVVYMKKAFEGLLDILHQYPESALMEGLGSLVAQYNSVSSRCTLTAKQLGVTLTPIDDRVANDNLRFIRYARFEGDIVYLRFGAFYLSQHLVPNNIISDTTSMYYAYQMAVNRVWHNWFDAIQELHAAGQLGGVILDMRGNSGGMVNDFQYAMGALLPSGGWSGSKGRVKNGLGRLDFAPLVPLSFSTYEEEHAVINDVPIVVLANTASGSLAENTTWSVMCQPNGYFIGTRTYGALSALNVSPENYSQTYSGAFGVRRVTPIYGSLPKFVILYGDDLHIAEGHGFDPDKEVVLDVNLYNSTGRDNQLESALDYIHSK